MHWVEAASVDPSARPSLMIIGGRNAALHPYENIALYEKLIAESELDQSRDEQRYKMLLTLLAEEKANIQKPLDS